ncbi:hypothetical membrane protein [Pelotomaculum thermopropionicum SI]|uniref:Hypothetical membrane protein n=1 Tax=Pelotomaculum thermopropionicum (strain DSM 13744 / JCM 10971 / SI) TaxID=370438 RepID=A5D099_PELTS|nr:hypothetical membrane protein [Pelotomaculum thermopropionicum SI]
MAEEQLMDSTLLAGIFGLIGTIIGSLIAGIYSYKGSKNAAERNIEVQNKVLTEAKELEDEKKREIIKTYAKLIYLDLLTAVFEGFQFLKGVARPNVGNAPPLLPMYHEYGKAITFISSEFNADELTLINKLYGIIEKIRHDIINLNYITNSFDLIRFNFLLLEVEVFGEKYSKIMSLDGNMITKDYLIYELHGKYKKIFDKLIELSDIR